MRPGGLTALSIFNFVFGGLAGLASLISLATLGAFYPKLAEQAQHTGQELPSMGLLYAVYGFAAVRAAVLVTSGIGYLGMRKLIGRWFGNVYAVLALAAIFIEIALTPQQISPFNLVEFVYPLITLFLLNTVFRKDFVR